MTNYIISAPPSRGKSYIASEIAVNLLKKNKIVFSNYPIIYTYPLSIKQRIYNLYALLKHKELIKPKQISTLKWDNNYMEKGLHDCTIILDEAYYIVNCHDKMKKENHDFFATTGHNNVDIYVIAQNYARLNVIIREMAMFIIVDKFSNPFSLVSSKGRKELTPLIFIVNYYLSEKDYNFKNMVKGALYKKEIHLFNKRIAESYNTQYYRKKEQPIFVISWLRDMVTNHDGNKDSNKNREEDWIKEMTKIDE